MNRPRKQRLIGFLVLLSAAVIFLPLILDGRGHRERQHLETALPDEPPVPIFATFEPQNHRADTDDEVAEPRPQVASTSAQDTAGEQPAAPVSAARITGDGSDSRAPVNTNATANTHATANDKATANSQAAAADDAAQAKQQPISIAQERPVLDKQGVPVAWTLQLASFREQGNATALRKKLQQKGYKTYIRRKDALSKVFVGPDLQRSEIEKLRSQLQREFKLDGLILRFTTG